MVLAHPQIARIERNGATMTQIGSVETAVEAKAKRCQRAQRIVVGAEIARAKGGRFGAPAPTNMSRASAISFFCAASGKSPILRPVSRPTGLKRAKASHSVWICTCTSCPRLTTGRTIASMTSGPYTSAGIGSIRRLRSAHGVRACPSGNGCRNRRRGSGRGSAFEISARIGAALVQPGGQLGVETDDCPRHPLAPSTPAIRRVNLAARPSPRRPATRRCRHVIVHSKPCPRLFHCHLLVISRPSPAKGVFSSGFGGCFPLKGIVRRGDGSLGGTGTVL